MTTREILAVFPKLSALVVGDICLDRWCAYDATFAEASRETGIPRIAVVATQTTAGAGGTVANNLAALGVGRVATLGVVGRDGFGWELKEALARWKIDSSLLVEAGDLQTFTYTKLLRVGSGIEDLPRVDFIVTRPMEPAVEAEVIRRLQDAAPRFEVILVSDQAETAQGGVVTAAVRETLASLARRYPEKVIWADSRMRAELFRDVIVKPNEEEAREASLRVVGHVNFAHLRAVIGPRPLVVTHGGKGVEIVEEQGTSWVETRPVDKPVDICGAGDSFSAGAAMTLAATGSIRDAVRMGNLVASVTIMKPGTGVASPQEVLEAEAGG